MRVTPRTPSRTRVLARQGGCGEAQTEALTTSRFLNSLHSRGIRSGSPIRGYPSSLPPFDTQRKAADTFLSGGLKTGSGAGFEPAYNVTWPAGFDGVGPATYYTPSYWRLSSELGRLGSPHLQECVACPATSGNLSQSSFLSCKCVPVGF